MTKSKASAKWQKALKNGSGEISSHSGAIKSVPYNFSGRFEGEAGTTPEELIAAAHASCFSMALSNEIDKAGMEAGHVETHATVNLEMLDDGPKVTKVHLDVSAYVPNGDEGKFNTAAETAKKNCPISKLLNAEITMDTSLKT